MESRDRGDGSGVSAAGSVPPEPDRCPRCHQPNHCAVAAGAGADRHCWCMGQPFLDSASPAVAAALAERSGPTCLCQACVQQLAALR